jgi:hypothetical protein
MLCQVVCCDVTSMSSGTGCGRECAGSGAVGGFFNGREVVVAGVAIIISGDVAVAMGGSGHEARGHGLGWRAVGRSGSERCLH